VALNDAAAARLTREAAQLGHLADSHVARLVEPPFQAGPPEARRTLIAVEYVGDHTLADEIRQHGSLTINELERLGEDLLQAMKFLDSRNVWHRDIKPDNLALRELERKGRELVLFDFSLAGTPDTEVNVGTHDYLDPFLGLGRRTSYDQAAELYSVAVTLHEMASGELPSWGDALIGARLLDPNEEVQLAEDIFDPVLRDGLVEFFRKALDRDAAKRFGSLREMTYAWADIFRDLDTVPPLTTSATVGLAESADADAQRERAAQEATASTPLAAAGLSPRALSIAQQRLGVSTVGELVHIPARRITKLRGIGSKPRYELIRRAREWRLRLRLSETAVPPGKIVSTERAVVQASDTASSPPVADAMVGELAPAEDELAHLSVDDIVARLIPDPLGLGLAVGLTGLDGAPPRVPPWADQREITAATGLIEEEVAARLGRLRNRWAKSVPALTPLRDDVLCMLEDHGRVLEWRQLAAALLARRGSGLDDAASRMTQAGVCVRAAIETEERKQEPRLTTRRVGKKVLVAVTRAGDETAPEADDLFAYAELLGYEADRLAARDPLPGVTEIKQVLRGVPVADQAPRLSDTDLVLLAAAASANAAATARLELYPRDLAAERAVKISQAVTFLGDDGLREDEVVQRVVARFPELLRPPKPTEIFRLLKEQYPDADLRRKTDGRVAMLSLTHQSVGSRIGRTETSAAGSGHEAGEYAWQRIEQSRKQGGFVAVKVSLRDATAVRPVIATLDGVAPVNVTALFIRTLREIVEEAGRPRWESVLDADSQDAPPQAKVGFARLLDSTWNRVEAHVRSRGDAIVFLHDATPLARYTGGTDLLTRLSVAARQSGEPPHGLWLFCPMHDPHEPPRLDGITVPVIPGDAEQLVVPGSFGTSISPRRAS
jgi:hypothetical protein